MSVVITYNVINRNGLLQKVKIIQLLLRFTALDGSSTLWGICFAAMINVSSILWAEALSGYSVTYNCLTQLALNMLDVFFYSHSNSINQ